MTRRVLVLVLLALAGCSKCGKKPEAAKGGIEQVLPRGAIAVVVVPSLKDSGAKLTLLEQVKVAGFVAPLQGFASAKAFADEVVRQLGVDVRSPAEMEKVGLDPARAMGAAVLLTGDVYLVLPVKDASALNARLEGISVNRFGAGAGAEQKQGDITVKTFSTQQGQPARLGYAIANGWAFVGRDSMIPKLGQAASLGETDRLSKDEQLAEALKTAGSHDLYAWLGSGSPVLQTTPLLNAFVTVSLSNTALEARISGQWKDKPELLAALTPQSAQDFSGVLPADAFLTARYTGDAKGLGVISRQLIGPNLARAFEAGGFELKTEVLDRLQPGTVLSLSLADRPPMDRGVPSFDIRQTNPFAYAHLSGVAPVSSAELIMPTLTKVAEVAPRFGAKLEKQQREGKDLFFTTWAQGQGVHFAPKGSLVAFASPVQRLDAVLASEAAPKPAAATSDAFTMSVDFTKLANSVRGLPESAWGLGGFALKPTTVRWLDATDDLKGLTVTAGAKDGKVLTTVKLSLAIAAPAPKVQ
ncbi:MAG: hypothetical protein GQE15_41030 [Archangiaceae bacterium]|nr:hypothetical protein [Archangiaceae bacterium]